MAGDGAGGDSGLTTFIPTVPTEIGEAPETSLYGKESCPVKPAEGV